MPFDSLPRDDVIYAEPHVYPPYPLGARVLAILRHHGWCQKTRRDVAGRFCLLGALEAAHWPAVFFMTDCPPPRRQLLALIRKSEPSYSHIENWNDARYRTFSEVSDLLNRWAATQV